MMLKKGVPDPAASRPLWWRDTEARLVGGLFHGCTIACTPASRRGGGPWVRLIVLPVELSAMRQARIVCIWEAD